MELKPCPFCGSHEPMVEVIPPHSHTFAVWIPDYLGSAVIECPNDDCGASIMARSLDEAAERWNRRVNDG